MRWFEERSLGWVFVTRMIGILTLLIFMVLAKILTYYITNKNYIGVVDFLFANFWLLLFIAIIMFIADMFSAFQFPLDLPAPIIKAFGSVFIIAFLLNFVQWLNINDQINQLFQILSFLIVPIVFILILITGYYEIIRGILWSGRANGTKTVSPDPTIGTPRQSSRNDNIKSWEDVGIEFRMMVYDLLHRIREEIHKDVK
ncbi:MAG: hypothetical protein ABR887_05450 [Methanoregulaceae archaeon]|jgi:hypothetical protein